MEDSFTDKEKTGETVWLRAAANNPAFDDLSDPAENLYSLSDGKPLHLATCPAIEAQFEPVDLLALAGEVYAELSDDEINEIEQIALDRPVVLRPLEEAERAEKLDAVTRAVIARRRKALQQLSDEPTSDNR